MSQLSDQDAHLYYDLMTRLQVFVAREQGVSPKIHSAEKFSKLSNDEKMQIRDALWNNPQEIDRFVEKNPDALSPEHLEIVKKWERFVSGNFQIERFLKKYTVFIGEEDNVYGVLGLYDPISDLLEGRPLPVMVRAVLIEFKGHIIIDGMLQFYNIYFGKGIRTSLREAYMRAKQKDRIITTLCPQEAKSEPARPRKAQKDWAPSMEEIMRIAEKIRGGPALQSAAFTVLRAATQLSQASLGEEPDMDRVIDCEVKVRRSLSRFQRVLARETREFDF